MTISIADAVADELSNSGVDRAFGLPGGEVLYLIDALRKKDIEFILCRHEADAGIMAAVYGKLKRAPGVAIATLGPGASNFMLAISNSYLDREPLLAISAQIPASWPATRTHQRIPFLECYRPVTKYASAVTAYTARSTVRQAVEACLTEPAGPSYLTISAEDAVHECFEPAMDKKTGPMGGNNPIGDPDAALESLTKQLSKAERPLVLLGIGIDQAYAESLRKWLLEWNLPVGVTPKVKGIVDETEDNFIGVVGGMSIDALMVEALHNSDLIVSFGFDPVEVDKGWHNELQTVWVLDAPLVMNVIPSNNLISVDYGALLQRLVAVKPPREWSDSFADIKRRRQAYINQGDEDNVTLKDNPIAIVNTLANILPPETIVTTDVGAHKYLFGQFWPNRNPETFFMSNGLSGMGYGLPAAIGAKLARPDAPVLAVLGDGGFSMNSQELETAVRIGIPLIVVVLADKSYSLIHLSQRRKGLPNYGVDFLPIDTVQVANACSMDGVRVDTTTELNKVVSEALTANKSLVVEIPLDLNSYNEIV